MKKPMARATLLLTVLIAVSVFAGCASRNSNENEKLSGDDSVATVTPSNDDASGAYVDYSEGFAEQVSIQIPVFDRAFEGWNVTDNFYTQWIQSEFGDKYNINVEFVAIGRDTQVKDYMRMLVLGNAPDIIFHYDMPQSLAYYAEDAIRAIDTEEIAYYAPTYWSNNGEKTEKYGSVDGKAYFFFAERPEAYNEIVLIRKDWIEAVGMEMPNNLEELNEVFAAWRDAGLGNGGGLLERNSFVYDYPFREWPTDEEERALYSDLAVAALTWEPTYEYLKNLNYQYNNKLIDTEFYLNLDDKAAQDDFVSGSSGVYKFFITSQTKVIENLLENDPDADVAILPTKARYPEGNVPQTRAYWPFGMIMGINYSTSDEERAAVWMYLEWLSQPENLFFLSNGVEGENYLMEEGIAVPIAEYSGESRLSNNNNKDYWCLVTESVSYENPELNLKANIMNWAPAGYEYLIEDAYEDHQSIQEYSTPDVLFTVIINSQTEYNAELAVLWQKLYVECVMATEEDFDDTYETACQIYLDAGYQEILDEKQTAIDAGNYY